MLTRPICLALLLASTAVTPGASAWFTMTENTAQSCGGTDNNTDGAVDQPSASSAASSSGLCGDGSSSSASNVASADIASGQISVSGEGVGFQELNGSFAQASFGDRLFVENVPAGTDSVVIRVTIAFTGVPPAPAFYNSASFDGSVNANVAPGQVRLQGCSGDLCFGGVGPVRTETLVEDVMLNRNGLGNFGHIDVFMDARFGIADASSAISGSVTVEILNEPDAIVTSESGVFGQGPDSDGDGVSDASDNCIEVANADQRDTNGDGFGNICDADLNDDCIVNAVDLGALRVVFFSADDDADFNGDGVVNASDLGVLKLMFFSPPGPSGATTACSS